VRHFPSGVVGVGETNDQVRRGDEKVCEVEGGDNRIALVHIVGAASVIFEGGGEEAVGVVCVFVGHRVGPLGEETRREEE